MILLMQQGTLISLQSLNPIIRIIKQRESLYFELLSFVNKNIESSSNDLDNITIFNKFLCQIEEEGIRSGKQQQQFLSNFSSHHRLYEGENEKQIERLSSRILQMLDTSLSKTRKSIFDEKGKTVRDFTIFKLKFHKIIKMNMFPVLAFVDHVLGFCIRKYERQHQKIQRYISKIQQGENIFFRQLYFKQNSDIEVNSSPEEKKPKTLHKTIKKTQINTENQVVSCSESPDKKVSKKKIKNSSLKKRERPLHIKNNKQGNLKEQTATKLYKFYAFLQLNKKEFFEDHVYNELEEGKHKKKLMDDLVQRNKTINTQIDSFVKRSKTGKPKKILMNKSSGDQKNQSLASKTSRGSLRTSFIISKRKSSFHLESSQEKIRSDHEKIQTFVDNTIKNVNPRRKTSQSIHRPQQKSKKLFVVKSPMVFQDEIPQAPTTQTQWFQHPLTNKGKQRKNQNLRLRRRNNPNPLQNTFLAETFRYQP